MKIGSILILLRSFLETLLESLKLLKITSFYRAATIYHGPIYHNTVILKTFDLQAFSPLSAVWLKIQDKGRIYAFVPNIFPSKSKTLKPEIKLVFFLKEYFLV